MTQQPPDQPERRPEGSQQLTFLGSQPPVGPPRNANVRLDRSGGRPAGPPEVRKTEQPQTEPVNQKFPAVLLIAPGFIALLFAASAAQFIGSGTGKKTALLIGAAGMVGAIACFGTLAAFSKEKGMQMFSAVMIGIALLAYAQSFLAMN